MKRLVPAFGVPLILAVVLTQGDMRLLAAPASGHPLALAPLPWTLGQAPSAPTTPYLRVTPRPYPASPSVPPRRTPGDVIPHTYMVYGLRTGPGGMAFTDRNGAVIPVPSNPQIILKPFNGLPVLPPSISPPTFTLPRTFSWPAPKK